MASFKLLLLSLFLSLCAFLASCSDAPEITVKPTKKIALSFDDAPRGRGPIYSGDERAKILIETLAQAKSGPVVFFVTTKGFANTGGKQRVESYANAGHLIANHSHTHQWLQRMETEDYIADIDQAELQLASFKNHRPWFRFPYLNEGTPLKKRDAVRNALKQRGLMNGYVTIDNYDWYIEDKWKKAVRSGSRVDMGALKNAYVDMLMGAVHFYDQAAVETFDRSPVHVILLHENDLAAMFIDDFIEALHADGWKIVSPDAAYADPIASIVPQTLKTRQGHVAALAIEAGRSPKTFTHMAIDEAKIDAFLLERNVFAQVQIDE